MRRLSSIPVGGFFLSVGRQSRFHIFENHTSDNPFNENFITTVRPEATLDKSKCITNKQLTGIPFHISDDAAVDALFRYHKTHVDIHSVERIMMPFWLCRSAVGGTFKSEYYTQDPTSTFSHAYNRWIKAPTFEYSYPLEEHLPLSQVSASYLHPASYIEELMCGTHVPSMLLSRYELLDELNRMSKAPTMIPFVMSTETAYFRIDKRVSRKLITQYAERELHKHYGSFTHSNISIISMKSDLVGIRPVYLPLYHFVVKTKSMPIPMPAYVCGAMGRVSGPRLHIPRNDKLKVIGATSMVTAAATALMLEAPLALTIGAAAGLGATLLHKTYLGSKCVAKHSQAMLELLTASRRALETDKQGYKWTVESEEAAEYQYREELRNRQRRKEAFEQRAKEEADREDARRTGRMFEGKHRARHDLIHSDRLGYYECLGLKGKERNATTKDIQTAFRAAVQKHHPDTNRGNEEAAKVEMHQVLKAYGVLRDTKKRKEYDAGGISEPADG